MKPLHNIFDLTHITRFQEEERFETILELPGLRIERIISTGQRSPEGFWYDQEEAEWVLLLSGEAEVAFDDGNSVRLKPGDYLMIPPHCRHRVASTSLDTTTVWLAVFIKNTDHDQ